MKPIPRETTIAALAIAITLLFILPLLILWNRPASVQTFQAPAQPAYAQPAYQPPYQDDNDIDLHFHAPKPKVVYVPTPTPPAPRTPISLTKPKPAPTYTRSNSRPAPQAVARTVNLTKATPVRSSPARTSSSRRR